jgi:hypothetical protein
VLSQNQNIGHQKIDFLEGHRPAFDHARYYLKMTKHAPAKDELRPCFGFFRLVVRMVAALIEQLLLELAFLGPIIFGASRRRLLLTMAFSATKRTAQIPTTGISIMG